MSSSTPEASSSDSEASDQVLPQRGATLASKRKGAFEPPPGSVLMDGPDDEADAAEAGEFDWDSVRDDDDIELWLIRVPNSVRLFVNLSLSFLFPPFCRFGHRLRPRLGSHPEGGRLNKKARLIGIQSP
jgi:hypothetical protein